MLAWAALALAGWPLTWVVPGLGLCGALATALVMKKGRR